MNHTSFKGQNTHKLDLESPLKAMCEKFSLLHEALHKEGKTLNIGRLGEEIYFTGLMPFKVIKRQ